MCIGIDNGQSFVLIDNRHVCSFTYQTYLICRRQLVLKFFCCRSVCYPWFLCLGTEGAEKPEIWAMLMRLLARLASF